jgi:serine/threonine protein kinase
LPCSLSLIGYEKTPTGPLSQCAGQVFPGLIPEGAESILALVAGTGKFSNLSRQVGEFWLEAHLASGGMADVFLASSRNHPGRLLVLKMLSARFCGDQNMLASFVDEARLLEKLRHPNLVQFFGSGSIGDLPFLALEYLEGDTLSVLRRQMADSGGHLPVSAVVRIGLQLANVLDYIHQARDEGGQPLQVVHRDISPQNIVLTYDGRIKLLDFGIALSRVREGHTRTGMLKGKLSYLSPEQINGEPLDGRSDLFSLGAVLWELCVGRRLFKGDNEFQVMKLICEVDAPGPKSERPDIPDRLDAVISSLLVRDRQKRLSSAARLREELGRLLFQEMADSSPRQLEQLAGEFLGERRRIKAELVDRARHRSVMESFLFADLEITDPDSVPLERQVVFKATTPSAASHPPDPPPEPAAQPKEERSKNYLLVFGGLVLLVLGLVLFLAGRKAPGPPVTHPSRPENTVGKEAQTPNPGPAQVETQNSDAAPKQPPPAEKASSLDPPQTEQTAEASQPPAEAVPAPPSPPDEVGYLRLNSTPEVEVYLEGELVGRTPVEDLPLRPGRYRVRVVNRQAHIDEKLTLFIKKGEITSQRLIYH